MASRSRKLRELAGRRTNPLDPRATGLQSEVVRELKAADPANYLHEGRVAARRRALRRELGMVAPLPSVAVQRSRGRRRPQLADIRRLARVTRELRHPARRNRSPSSLAGARRRGMGVYDDVGQRRDDTVRGLREDAEGELTALLRDAEEWGGVTHHWGVPSYDGPPVLTDRSLASYERHMGLRQRPGANRAARVGRAIRRARFLRGLSRLIDVVYQE